MELHEQIKQHKELSKKIEELEEQKKQLGLAIMDQMESKTLQVPGFLVRCHSRLSYKVSLEEAVAFKATKMEEVIDKAKIKELYHAGHAITGVKEIKYISIIDQAF